MTLYAIVYLNSYLCFKAEWADHALRQIRTNVLTPLAPPCARISAGASGSEGHGAKAYDRSRCPALLLALCSMYHV